jgi:vacuolar-type H+-ATPase subunit I/STV1
MDYELISKIVNRKRKKLKTFTLEQMGIAGFVSGFIGLVLGEFYSTVLGGLVWQIANVFIYAGIGASIVYFTSKGKKEELQVEIMLLEYIEKSQTKTE